MTRIPVDVGGKLLIKRLRRLGYEQERQSGSHITCTTQVGGEHHAYVPNHTPIKVGTLRKILKEVADHHGLSLDMLLRQLEL